MERPIDISKGDVISVVYPFTGGSGEKARPALIIAESRTTINICAITSKCRGIDEEITLEDKDFQVGKLSLVSYVRIDIIHTDNKDIIKKKIGTLKNSKFNEVIDAIINYLKKEKIEQINKIKALERPK